MRPIYHPSIEEVTVEGILYALADPLRARIFLQLMEGECKNCSAFLTLGGVELAKSTLSQHFKVLREAGLIRSERKGVELRNISRCAELKKRFGPLLKAIAEAYENEAARKS